MIWGAHTLSTFSKKITVRLPDFRFLWRRRSSRDCGENSSSFHRQSLELSGYIYGNPRVAIASKNPARFFFIVGNQVNVSIYDQVLSNKQTKCHSVFTMSRINLCFVVPYLLVRWHTHEKIQRCTYVQAIMWMWMTRLSRNC